MKKLFFCVFITLFITLCVWLSLVGECNATFVDASGVTFTNTIVVNDNDPQTILTALSSFDFTYNNTQYLEWSDISSIDYILYQGYFNDNSYLKCSTVIDAFPNGCTISYSFNSSNLNYYNFSATPYAHLQIDNVTTQNANYPITLKVTYWYKPNGDWYSYPLPNSENRRLLSNFDFTYTPPNDNSVDFDGSLGSSGGGNEEEEEEDKTLLETIQDFFGGFFETIIGVITDEYNAVVDFFTNLPEIFMHIFIPTKEEYEDLTERFSDQITDRFLIIPLTRNGESYDNTDKYAFIGGNKPHLLIYGYDFDMNELYTALRTPINFGYVQDSNVQSFWYRVDNSNVTPYFIINFVIMVNFIAMNMALYNKFFDKE